MRIRMNWNVGTLVGIVVTGVMGYLGGMETKKELDILAEGGEVTLKDKVVEHVYGLAPAAAAAAMTIFCYRKVKLGYEAKIADQAAKLALAALTTKQFKDYQDAAKEVVGEETADEIKKRAIDKDIARKQDQYFGIKDQQHLFQYEGITFRATTSEVINGIVELGRDIFDDSEMAYANHGIGKGSVTELLTYWGQSHLADESTDETGWTRTYLEDFYGTNFFDYTLQPKKDRTGREYINIVLYKPIENFQYWSVKEKDIPYKEDMGVYCNRDEDDLPEDWMAHREKAGLPV